MKLIQFVCRKKGGLGINQKGWWILEPSSCYIRDGIFSPKLARSTKQMHGWWSSYSFGRNYKVRNKFGHSFVISPFSLIIQSIQSIQYFNSILHITFHHSLHPINHSFVKIIQSRKPNSREVLHFICKLCKLIIEE